MVTQMGLEMQGDVDVLGRGLTLALSQALGRSGYVVRHGFAGGEFVDRLPRL